MTAGSGGSTFVGGVTGDTMTGAAGVDTFTGGSGNDTITGAGGTTNSHAHTFLEFPDQTFYMPNATAFHGLADAPTGTYDSET